ncbi:MAG: ImmA/IrrE family metallo-endopeptidase, partial [Kiritimatiellae bacterium]|nr:ImmA/IrrE family metallo-endopeptidase [Kiritimatiellia bacterium]
AAPIHIPWWRYAQIEDAVLELYRKADARTMPLEIFEVASALDCSPIPYHALGPVLFPVLAKYSEDGFSAWHMGNKWTIYYNGRKPIPRQRFTIAHELGHVMLGHKEHSVLAEHEANHFAAAALCPLPLLALYGIRQVPDVARIFKISEEYAGNRLSDLRRWEKLEGWKHNRKFGTEVRERFQLLEPYQPLLFQTEDAG